MRHFNKIVFKYLLGSAVILVNMIALAPEKSLASNSTTKSPQKIFMKLSHGTDDLHAVLMTFKIAGNLLKGEAKVTLFLNLEGVRIADKRQPLDLYWGIKGGHSVQQLYDNFLKHGGTILVCPMCAKNAGLNAKNLRSGTKITNEEEISLAILNANKILSF